MKPILDYSKDLRRKLAEGKTFDQPFGELRKTGASIFDCIASVRSLQGCTLEETKKLVHSSSVWSDGVGRTEESFRELINADAKQS